MQTPVLKVVCTPSSWSGRWDGKPLLCAASVLTNRKGTWPRSVFAWPVSVYNMEAKTAAETELFFKLIKNENVGGRFRSIFCKKPKKKMLFFGLKKTTTTKKRPTKNGFSVLGSQRCCCAKGAKSVCLLRAVSTQQ